MLDGYEHPEHNPSEAETGHFVRVLERRALEQAGNQSINLTVPKAE